MTFEKFKNYFVLNTKQREQEVAYLCSEISNKIYYLDSKFTNLKRLEDLLKLAENRYPEALKIVLHKPLKAVEELQNNNPGHEKQKNLLVLFDYLIDKGFYHEFSRTKEHSALDVYLKIISYDDVPQEINEEDAVNLIKKILEKQLYNKDRKDLYIMKLASYPSSLIEPVKNYFDAEALKKKIKLPISFSFSQKKTTKIL